MDVLLLEPWIGRAIAGGFVAAVACMFVAWRLAWLWRSDTRRFAAARADFARATTDLASLVPGTRVTLRGVLEHPEVGCVDAWDGGRVAVTAVALRAPDRRVFERVGTRVASGLALRVGDRRVALAGATALAVGSRETSPHEGLARCAREVRERVADVARGPLAIDAREAVFSSLRAGDAVVATGLIERAEGLEGLDDGAHERGATYREVGGALALVDPELAFDGRPRVVRPVARGVALRACAGAALATCAVLVTGRLALGAASETLAERARVLAGSARSPADPREGARLARRALDAAAVAAISPAHAFPARALVLRELSSMREADLATVERVAAVAERSGQEATAARLLVDHGVTARGVELAERAGDLELAAHAAYAQGDFARASDLAALDESSTRDLERARFAARVHLLSGRGARAREVLEALTAPERRAELASTWTSATNRRGGLVGALACVARSLGGPPSDAARGDVCDALEPSGPAGLLERPGDALGGAELGAYESEFLTHLAGLRLLERGAAVPACPAPNERAGAPTTLPQWRALEACDARRERALNGAPSLDGPDPSGLGLLAGLERAVSARLGDAEPAVGASLHVALAAAEARAGELERSAEHLADAETKLATDSSRDSSTRQFPRARRDLRRELESLRARLTERHPRRRDLFGARSVATTPSRAPVGDDEPAQSTRALALRGEHARLARLLEAGERAETFAGLVEARDDGSLAPLREWIEAGHQPVRAADDTRDTLAELAARRQIANAVGATAREAELDAAVQKFRDALDSCSHAPQLAVIEWL